MMTNRARRFVGVLAVGGAAMLAYAAAIQPASASTSSEASFYTGKQLTGMEISPDLDNYDCHNLPEAALSAVNTSSADIAVYYNTDCRTGWPGVNNDTYFALGSLHWSNFPRPALSYRVLPNN
ncbi:hypothetical protein ACWD3J_42850 [Streptomyces sp. NPDC002755]